MTLRQALREWRCSRRNAHGPDGFYEPLAVQANPSGSRVWLQECQACGRFTCWFEPGDAVDAAVDEPCLCDEDCDRLHPRRGWRGLGVRIPAEGGEGRVVSRPRLLDLFCGAPVRGYRPGDHVEASDPLASPTVAQAADNEPGRL